MYKIVKYHKNTIENNGQPCKIIVLCKIKNDLYESFLVLQQIYKNFVIEFKDRNNNPVIPYGSLFIKDRNNSKHTIYWKAKDRNNKEYKGFFMH